MNTKVTTPMGVATESIEAAPQFLNEDDAAAAFLSKWVKRTLRDTQASEAPEEDDSEDTGATNRTRRRLKKQ